MLPEIEASKDWSEKKVIREWRDGWLAVDGTTIPLFQKPGLHGEAWFDKSSQYSMNGQFIILLHNLCIVNYSLGHTGSAHDSYAFQSTDIASDHEKILSNGEWMWAIPHIRSERGVSLLSGGCVTPSFPRRRGASIIVYRLYVYGPSMPSAYSKAASNLFVSFTSKSALVPFTSTQSYGSVAASFWTISSSNMKSRIKSLTANRGNGVYLQVYMKTTAVSRIRLPPVRSVIAWSPS